MKGLAVSNTSPVEETLNVTAVQVPSIVKSFAPNTIWVGQTSVLTINVTNNDPKVTLTEAALTDTLPAGVELANPLSVTLTNCGDATYTAAAGGNTITLNNATIAPGTTCRIQASVTSLIDDAYTNTIPVGDIETGDGLQTKQGVTNGSPASANLNVQAVGIQKSFSPTTIQAGETSQLTITLLNPTGENYTGVYLDDVLPGTVLEVVDDSAATTCTADGSSSIDPLLVSTTAPRTVSLTGGIIRAGSVVTPGSCTVTVTVQAPLSASDQTHTNTIPANAMTTDQGITNPVSVSANLRTEALSIDISKNFSPDRIQAGGTTTLTITLSNQTTNPYTGVTVVDNLANVESGLLVADPSNASTTCGGTLTAVPGSTIIRLEEGEIPAIGDGGSCTITVTITTPNEAGNDSDTLTNRIDANTASSTEGVTNLQSASDNLTVYEPGLGLTGNKSFVPSVITTGQTTYVQIQIYAPADQELTNFSLEDTLPEGVYITNSTTPNLNRCGPGTLTADEGSRLISLSNATISAGDRCRIRVWVTSDVQGTYTNVIEPGDIDNEEKETLTGNLSAQLRVTDFTISKAFYPSTVNPGGLSTLTITLTNTNLSPLEETLLQDYLSSMGGGNVVIAPEPNASTTCPDGSVTADAGTQLIQMTGGASPRRWEMFQACAQSASMCRETAARPHAPIRFT